MKKKNILLLFALFALNTTSCVDMLDVERHGSTEIKDFYSNDDEAMQALAAIYGYMCTVDWHGFETMGVNAMADDGYSAGGDRGAIFQDIAEFRYTPEVKQLANYYKVYYNTIYLCNVVINKVDPEVGVISKRCVAEAKVLRAFVYLRLASFFGSCPVITTLLSPEEYQQPNNSQEEIFAQVEKDLKEAIDSNVLLEKKDKNDKVSHVTKQTAQALLGKALVFESTYLNKDKWAEARTAFDAVIKSNKYELVKDNYGDIWHKKGRFSTESMFETNVYPDEQNMITVWGHAYFGWRMERFNQIQVTNANAQGANISSQKVWGFFNPTKSLYDAFVELEGEDGYRLNQVIITYKQMQKYPLSILKGKYVYGNEGYFGTKLAPTLDDEVTPVLWAKDQVFMRYAEVLLLAAEAELPEHGGNQSKVDDYVNAIRIRARVSNLPGGYTLEDVQKEKRLECCFEGTRFPDLVRWGIAKDVLKDFGKKIPSLYGLYDGSDNGNEKHENVAGYNVLYTTTGGNGFVAGKHEFYPIPQAELNVNPNAKQHTGW